MKNSLRITLESRTAIQEVSQNSGLHYSRRDVTIIWFEETGAMVQTYEKLTCNESRETRQVNHSKQNEITNPVAAYTMANLLNNSYEIVETIDYQH